MSTAANPPPPRVFISYTHESPEHEDRVLALADRLREDEVDANIDQYEEAPPEGWPRWMVNQITEADFVLVISCLSGCFSKPQLVVYGHAAPSVSENLARVPVDVRYRGGLPEVFGSVPLAGRLYLPALQEPELLPNRETAALAMH